MGTLHQVFAASVINLVPLVAKILVESKNWSENCVDILCHCGKYAIFVLIRDVKLQLTNFKLSALYKSFTYILSYLLTLLVGTYRPVFWCQHYRQRCIQQTNWDHDNSQHACVIMTAVSLVAASWERLSLHRDYVTMLDLAIATCCRRNQLILLLKILPQQ